jgi:hypothetical protein
MFSGFTHSIQDPMSLGSRGEGTEKEVSRGKREQLYGGKGVG